MDDLPFLSFSIVCQSYQDDGWVIMKGFVQRNFVYGLEDFALNVLELWISSQRLTHRAAGAHHSFETIHEKVGWKT